MGREGNSGGVGGTVVFGLIRERFSSKSLRSYCGGGHGAGHAFLRKSLVPRHLSLGTSPRTTRRRGLYQAVCVRETRRTACRKERLCGESAAGVPFANCAELYGVSTGGK